MNIDKRALKGVVDEIEASRARQKGETEFQREALKRAVKNHQLDAKAIRIVLQRRAMGDTKRDEQDYYVHSYEVALGGKKDALDALEQGASIRQAAKAGGISTGAAAALAKGVQESSFVNRDTGEITTARLDTVPGGGDTTTGRKTAAAPAGDTDVARFAPHLDERADTATQLAEGNSAHEGEENGSNSNGEGRGSEGLQPERQCGRGGNQGGDGGARDEDGSDPRPEQRAGGPRGVRGDHQPADRQHVVRPGGDEGAVSGAGRGVDPSSTPPLGAVGSLQGDRVAAPESDDPNPIPTFLRREKVRA